MTFIPDEELKDQGGLTLAPMIDFLFLMLAIFASLAVSRIVMRETEIELVKSTSEAGSRTTPTHEFKLIHITVAEDGSYKWVTEIRDYPMSTADEIALELIRQKSQGLLPEDPLKTQVLLNIDQKARWEPILNVMLAIKEAGFEIRPVYEPISLN